ncbi:MAG: hypothetical protein ACYS47_12415 [Planctomycetota bacterium]|jgi:hypothetical protein
MNEQSKRPITRWTRLALCLLAVLAFIFVVGPWLSRAPLVKPLTRFIEERDIDAGALFYTEVEAFSDADVTMRNVREFSPRQHPDDGE